MISSSYLDKKINELEGTIKSDYWNKFKGLSFVAFNDLIGLPEKKGVKKKMFQYELDLLQTLENEKHVWVKKATGLGITEFTLRWIAWLCLKDDNLKKRHKDIDVLIITGPRLDLAITLMDRMKNLFDDHIFKEKNTLLVLNGIRIEAFPSHHLAAARGLSPQIVFLDEADFFPPGQQIEARSISERYIAKTNPHIIFVSTPNNPGGLYEEMEKEEPSMYHKILMDYKIGLRDGMFTEQEIEENRKSPSFEREYNLQYGVGSGNIFQGVDEILENYNLTITHGKKALFCDPAYGSSKFGIIGAEQLDGVIYVKECTQYERPSPSAMLDIVLEKAKLFDNNVYVDSAHPGLIRDLQNRGVNAHAVKFGSTIDGKEKEAPTSLLSIMTIEAAQAVREKRIRINPIFKDVIAQLKAIKFNDKGHPDKKEMTFDLGDCILMCCNYFKTNRLKVIKI